MSSTQHIELKIHDWTAIFRMRARLEKAFEALPQDTRNELIFSAVELVEQGLLHSERQRAGEPVVLRVTLREGEVELSVTSRSSAARAAAVVRSVAEITARPDKRHAYVARLLELARVPYVLPSQLGLHRIVLDGHCSLTASHERGRLVMSAKHTV